MNDRMTELHAKACLYARDKHLEDKDVPAFIQCMSEKFAELIVRECMDIATEQAEKTKRHIKSPGDRHESRVHGALDVLSAIMKHFGVEE